MANEFKIKNGLVVSGSADIEQDLIVRGKITADELNISIVSSSVLYESGSTKFGDSIDDNHSFTGSVDITGSISLNGQAIGTGKLDETTFNSFTSSYNTVSGSINTRLGSLESFSSSLDTSFVSETEFGNYSGSINSFTSSIDGRVDSLETESGSIRGDFNSFTSSYTNVSTSLDSRLDSLETLSGSFTGSFSGSFKGDGTNLFNIPASGVTGLNLTQIADGSVTASVSNTNGLRVNSKSEITGSLIVTNGITGSIDYNNLTNVPTLISGSSQILITGTTGYSIFSSSISSSIGGLSSSVATTTLGLGSSIGSLSSSVVTTTSGLSSSIGLLSSSVATTTTELSSSIGSNVSSLSSSVATTTSGLGSGISSLSSSVATTTTELSSSIGSNVSSLSSSVATTTSGLSSGISSLSSSVATTTSGLSSSIGGLSSSVATTTSGLSSSIGGLSSSVATTTSGLSSSVGSLSSSVAITTLGLGSNIGSLSSSVATTTSGLSSSIGGLSSSVATINLGQNNRLDSIEGKTGSYATTGSNIFIGNQTITGSLYISQNLIVQGSSSLENITASAVSIGTNKILLNSNTPSIRYAGISVFDSGSTNVTASLFYDSLTNNWKFQHSDVGTDDASILIYGPLGTGIDNAPTLDGNFLTKVENNGHGHHLTTSSIFDNGTKVSINSNSEITGSLTVTGVVRSTTTPLVSGSNQINHNTTTNYVANQHIDHTTVLITTADGSGLTGGGDITTTRPLSIATGGVTNAMLAGSIGNDKLSNSSFFVGTTSISLGRGSASQTLNGVSIEGNAGTVTNGVYTTGTQTITGEKTFSAVRTNIDGSLVLKSGTANGIFFSSFTLNNLTLGITNAGTTFNQSLIFPSNSANSYTFPNASGTFALTGDIPTLSGLGGQPQLNGTGFVKVVGTTVSYDNSTYLTTLTDTLATVTARGNTTTGNINVNGNILLTGTATTTNQARTIDFTGFDKEGTTDFSDRAYIQHTTNTGGHAGSVLVISSENDADDGIAFLTNASSKLKHNSNNIATEAFVTSQGYITSAGTATNVSGTVAVANGGTGATDAATARTNLGLAIGTNVLAQRTFGTAANNNTGDFAAFNAVHFVGTTSIAANRASASQTLTGVSIDGSAGGAGVLNASGGLTTQYGNGTVGYTFALTNPQTGLFPAVDNSNSILTVNRHPDNYYSQLGFSSNGNLYYRSFSAAAINTSATWRTIIDSGNIGSQTVSNVSGTVAVANGGTGATDAAAARTNLGLAIGTNVLAQRTFGTAANNNTGDFATATQGTTADAALPRAGGTMTGTITITSTDIRSNASSGWTGDPGAQGKIQYHANRWYIVADSSSDRIVQFRRNATDVSHIANDGTFVGNITGTAGSAPNGSNVNSFYNVTAGDGNGVRFWSSDEYKISMGVGSLYQYGPVTDYSIKMQMDAGSPGRGFTWGRQGVAPIAALNGTSGNMQIAGSLTTGGSILPLSNNSVNLGSASLGWANIFTNDLHLSNMNKPGGNDIDGTNGTWTIQEGAENLYIINNNNGKKFKINLEEII